MARYIYEWKPTEHGSRLFRRPGTGPATASAKAAPPAEPELQTLNKAELVNLADDRGVDPSGTKADIIERLEADDEQD